MPKCPICKTTLETVRQREGLYYPCRLCNGRAVTIPQIRHVLGERVVMKLLRLMRLNPRPSPHLCPFCEKPMLVVNSQDPQIQVDICRSCNAVWFDEPTYECLPELAGETTNSLQMQMTEVFAMDRLEDLKKKMEEERKSAQKKKKPLHRIFDSEKDGLSGPGR
jgi:Zn-finger nucleic acid-binding protein